MDGPKEKGFGLELKISLNKIPSFFIIKQRLKGYLIKSINLGAISYYNQVNPL